MIGVHAEQGGDLPGVEGQPSERHPGGHLLHDALTGQQRWRDGRESVGQRGGVLSHPSKRPACPVPETIVKRAQAPGARTSPKTTALPSNESRQARTDHYSPGGTPANTATKSTSAGSTTPATPPEPTSPP